MRTFWKKLAKTAVGQLSFRISLGLKKEKDRLSSQPGSNFPPNKGKDQAVGEMLHSRLIVCLELATSHVIHTGNHGKIWLTLYNFWKWYKTSAKSEVPHPGLLFTANGSHAPFLKKIKLD